MPQYRNLDITPAERVKRYKRFYGGLVFDKLYSLGIRETSLSQEFRPLRQDMVLAGHALTVKIHSHAESEEVLSERGNKPWGGGPKQKLVMEAVTPGCVICIDTGPSFVCAQWGEMSSHLAQSQGAAGALIAGNVRDTRIILQMEDFPVYTMGYAANARTGWIVNEINTPIYLPGHPKHSVKIFPDDFIFGDTDGVQVIPAEVIDEVMLRCEELLDRENDERKKIKAGMSIDDVYSEYGAL
ncbi:MAG: RraA family protein [Candidatus Latescibacteria bacterium]|nr:RraA family protein [Candidatus Latescibacterota bacterium]